MLQSVIHCIFDHKYFVQQDSQLFREFFGVRTNEYPKASCQEIANIKTALRYLARSGTTIDNTVIINAYLLIWYM